MRDSWFLLFDTPRKPLTEEQARLRRIGQEYIDKLVLGGVYPATAANVVCELLEPHVQGFIKSQYGDLVELN